MVFQRTVYQSSHNIIFEHTLISSTLVFLLTVSTGRNSFRRIQFGINIRLLLFDVNQIFIWISLSIRFVDVQSLNILRELFLDYVFHSGPCKLKKNKLLHFLCKISTHKKQHSPIFFLQLCMLIVGDSSLIFNSSLLQAVDCFVFSSCDLKCIPQMNQKAQLVALPLLVLVLTSQFSLYILETSLQHLVFHEITSFLLKFVTKMFFLSS